MDHSQFEIWMKERKLFKLFFDGVSKGNLGVARGGGIIISLEGNNEYEHYWNIGIDTNNMAEAYGLWKGIKKLESLVVEEPIVIGDSRLIIQAMDGTSHGKSLILTKLIKIIQTISRTFRHLEFAHILRELNTKADQAANKAINLQTNDLYANY